MYQTFAWRYFKAKKTANTINIIAWVTVGVIAFAVACQILVLSVFNGFEDLVKSLYSSFYTDIKIIPAKGKTFFFTPAQLTQLKQINGISNLAFIAEEKALLQNDQNQQTKLYLKGVDNNYIYTSGVAARTIEGKFNTGTKNDPGLIVGAGIQNAAGINVSGAFSESEPTIILPKKVKISVEDPLQSLSEGKVRATGVFAIQQDFDNNYAITNIDFVKQQMGFQSDEYSALEIKLTDKTNILQTQQAIASLLGANYTVQTKYEQNTSLYSTMRMEKWVIFALFTLVLLVSAFTMISSLSMLVLEKQKDIAVLRSLGANQPMILKIFLSEGLLLGGIGAAIGMFMAVAICLIQIKFKLIKLTGGSFLINYFPVKLQGTDFLLVLVTVSFITCLASWFPARKAARQTFELRGS